MFFIAAKLHEANFQDKKVAEHKYSWYIWISLPILLHLWLVHRLAVNVPYIDDYTFLVDCINWQEKGLTLADCLKRLLHPHGEHIILFARLTALIDYGIEGSLNFRTLFFVGNLTFIGSVYILFRLAQRGGLQPMHFLPVVLLLFHPQFYENTTTWAICALQHLPALFFAFWSFDLMSRSSQRAFFLSLPIAFIAVFSNGNGLIVLGIGLLLVITTQNRVRLLTWLVFMGLTLGLYLYIHHLSHSPEMGSNISHPVRVIAGFFLMAGSVGLLFTRSLLILSVVGVCVVGFIGLLISSVLVQRLKLTKLTTRFPALFRQVNASLLFERSFLVLTACYLYAVLTLFAIAFARSIGWYQSLLLPRFIWFAAIAMAVGYLLTLHWIKTTYRPRVSRIALVISVIVYCSSYWFNLGESITVRQLLVSDTHNWRENKTLISLPADTKQHDHFYSDILQAAVQKGVYQLPPLEAELTSPKIRLVPTSPDLMVKDSSFAFGSRRIHCLTVNSVNGNLYSRTTGPNETYLILKSSKHTFMWPVNQSRTKLSYYLQTGRSNWSANTVWVFADQLPPATYQFSLAWLENGQWNMTPGFQRVRVEEGQADKLCIL